MSYTRQPNVILSGRGLKQTPSSTTKSPAGIVSLAIDADIASSSALGVVQVGSGLSITPTGVLSVIGGSSLLNTYLTAVDYTFSSSDQYIGGTKKNITITLPVGINGKYCIVKNQTGDGSIKVQGNSGQQIDNVSFKTLGEQNSLIVVFDGMKWNTI